MKSLFTILAILFGHSATAQTNAHPMLHQLAAEADVIAVAKLREPRIWFTSELIRMTGQSTALVERTLKGKELSKKITVLVVRHIDIENITSEPPQVPIEAKNFPVTPSSPSKFAEAETTNLDHADKVIVFLRGSQDGELSAVDGFLYTIPYSGDLESAVLSAVKNQAQQASAIQPATRPEPKSEDSEKPQPEAQGRSR
jgi:hypothetical protein